MKNECEECKQYFLDCACGCQERKQLELGMTCMNMALAHYSYAGYQLVGKIEFNKIEKDV